MFSGCVAGCGHGHSLPLQLRVVVAAVMQQCPGSACPRNEQVRLHQAAPAAGWLAASDWGMCGTVEASSHTTATLSLPVLSVCCHELCELCKLMVVTSHSVQFAADHTNQPSPAQPSQPLSDCYNAHASPTHSTHASWAMNISSHGCFQGIQLQTCLPLTQ